MVRIETNIFEILNISDLNCKYRKYRIRGLNRESNEYHKNVGFIVKKMSAKTRSPCQVISEGNISYIAQPEGFPELPNTLDLIGTTIKIEKELELYELCFDDLENNENDMKLALRFLQFSIQQPLMSNNALWQPQAGGAYYNKVPDRQFKEQSDKVDLYRGFNLRVVCLSKNRLGLCVDTSSKYLAQNFLPTTISPNDFQRFKGKNCLYQYGDDWYEVRISGRSDLTISEVPVNDKTLFDTVHEHAGNRKSQALIALPKDCTALIYMNKFNQERNIPSGLCKLTYTTDHHAIQKLHSRTIKPPHIRRQEIQFIVDNNLKNLSFGSVRIKLSNRPINVSEEKIPIPDIKFGNEKVISIIGTPGSKQVNPPIFGRMKKEMLYGDNAGPYVKRPLTKQYFILPNSIHESVGDLFLKDLKHEFNLLYPEEEISYSPIVVPYNDSVQRTPYEIGGQILKTIEENSLDSGFGIVMIPRLRTPHGKEDPLGNLVMAKLREMGIYVSIIHTNTIVESYIDKSFQKDHGKWGLVDNEKQRKRYKGYVKNVVLNKILLTNSHWPFVLDTALHADLTIGIDVKHNTVGFTLIYQTGAEILFQSSNSDQKERLSRMHMHKKVKEIIEEEQKLKRRKIKNIVIHRDGIMFPSEIDGIKNAIKELIQQKIIDPDAEVSFIEIRKTSRNPPLRLFRLVTKLGVHGERTFDPYIGTTFVLSDNEAFICNTGEPYRRKGTSQPLHIVKREGSLPIEKLLHDIFLLSNLTWTKIDDCSRVPMSIKMNDIRLREIAGDFDEDLLKYGEDLDGDEDE